MQLTKNFILQEFVSRTVFQMFGEKAIQFLDPRMVQLAQFYADYFGKPLTINNWNAGGTFNERGFRDPLSSTGAARSQHKFGRAFDCNIEGVTPHEAYYEIMANQSKFSAAGLRCMENIDFTSGWLHSDVRDTSGHGIGKNLILIVKP